MTVLEFKTDASEANRFVEILTADGGDIVGYRLGGARPGPSLMVAGYAPLALQVFDRLLALPTLPWLRGTLTLVSLGALNEGRTVCGLDHAPNQPVDEVLFLPFAADSALQDAASRTGYWMVLRLCAKLGMIDGRGIIGRR
ncbi:hypothetical protein KUH32_16185 [Thalassococcus sp. CAU 1522]|uniref:Uncharacterized protein n=1 Tax=Thalassococcus arenae TaxID=2851652 RepID=A0ABS6NB99_9RHOB|nr:hypothetical protein [Thalassococcus arenae]MBV2361304.1 hypothetical protein [Thalassococcus arenae]